jgi:carbon-monoxide dehydrogenase medium subunit
MKPPVFDYVAATSIDMAIAALAEAGGDAKILAGGQSLVPMLNFRLLRPSILVDINRIPDLAYIEDDERAIRVGALTRHYQIETSPLIARAFPILACAMTHVAHLAIRNRGTIGGSLSHADPAAELPMLAMLLDAELRIASASGTRTVAARDFLLDALTVDLGGAEVLTEILLPKLPPDTGWGFEEVARRHGDFALAAVAATLTVSDGVIRQARIALTGVGPTPLRAAEAEAMLVGHAVEPALLGRAVDAVRAAITPETDLHASADYRRHLAGVLAGRAVTAAWRRAHESAAKTVK